MLNDLEHYSPYKLKKLRLKGHYTTNAAEGSFGNIKKWTDDKILPLHKVLQMFVHESTIQMKRHMNVKYPILDQKIHKGRKLGLYAIQKIQKRIDKCNKMKVELSNENENIGKCNCPHDDIPCIHIIYERLFGNNIYTNIINEEEISIVHFFNEFERNEPRMNSVITVKNNDEMNW